MASAAVEKKQPAEVEGEMCVPAAQEEGEQPPAPRGPTERSQLSRLGIPTLDVCFCTIFHDALILRRDFSNKMLREELQLLQKPGSYVGEVVKVMGKSKVLVKASGPMYCYKDGKLTALEEANQPDGIYVHEKCVVWAPQVYFSREITLDDELSHFRDTSSLLSQSYEQLLLRYELQSDQSLLEEYHFPYDSNWLKTQINRGLEFWLGYREASFVSEDEKWKCQFCDFVSDCPFSVTSSRDRIRSR
ncbi:hypothetical protein ZIOFF_031418 [Zingiber officinale]|uniref:Uncharacterized protein n=1 Tax=Zingiber officinale TaxID=94328 RepID=A0A8J5GLY1_ZINOF|nr:hypothetical protein ZIOFF_031418 [Zingiber officinale]